MPRRARKDLDKIQDRRAEVVRLRAEGKAWDQIAALTGFSNGSAASKAWKRAIQQHPDQSVDEVRRQEKTRLEQMDSVMSEIVSNPPIRATSIGRVMWDPRSCTCGVRGDTKRDHAEDCQVQPVLDAGAVVRASAERRALGESLRKLVGADAATGPATVLDARSLTLITEVRTEQQTRDRIAPPPPLAPLPREYDGLTPAEQAKIQLDRRRAQVATQQAVIQGEITD